MFWAFKTRDEIKKRFADDIKKGRPLIIRDEKTMSGRVHVGSLRGVAIHGLISEVLTDAGIKNTYLFEINDFDPMDGLPKNLDQAFYKPFMGKLLCDVPAPDKSAINFAEYWANEFMSVVEKTGFKPELYRSSTLYREGKYNTVIKLALDNADAIRVIYKKVSGSVKDSDWLPVQVVCEACGKVGTTKAIGWDGTYVTYACLKKQVAWAEGCGHEGRVDPFDGRAKLPWKVEWPAKFRVLGVDIEGAGKDHNTKGGSRDIARNILKDIFKYPEPFNIPYDFFVIGGKKMSSSKGAGSSSKEVSDLLPRELLRLLMFREPKRVIEFEPTGETIPNLYDQFDKISSEYFSGDKTDWSEVMSFLFSSRDRKNIKQSYLPRFTNIAYLTQMPHIVIEDKVEGMKGEKLNAADRIELDKRIYYAKHWLQLYSPEKYKFEIQKKISERAQNLSAHQKEALRALVDFMKKNENAVGEELHTAIHEIKKEQNIEPRDLFSAIYLSFLGKESGPQVGWFLSALDRSFVLDRLTEASQ